MYNIYRSGGSKFKSSMANFELVLVDGRRCWIDLNFLNIKSKTSLLRNKGIYTKNMLVLSVLPFF